MPDASAELHTIEGHITRETDKAILIVCEKIDGNEWDSEIATHQWFPISQMSSITRSPNLRELDKIKIKRWILQKQGIV